MESKHASPFAEGSRQGHFFGFAFFTADFLAPFFTLLFEKPGRSFTRVTALAHERPRSLVIGHVLLRGHARNGAADDVESQVLQRFEADATFTHVELLAALLVFTGEPGRESGMSVEAQEMHHHARLLRCERNKWQRHFGILAIARRIHG